MKEASSITQIIMQVVVAMITAIVGPLIVHRITKKSAKKSTLFVSDNRGGNVPIAELLDRPAYAITSITLGGVSLLAWCLPILGLPISVLGIIFGITGRDTSRRGLATCGLVLSFVGLLASVANAAIGAYLGYTQQLFGPGANAVPGPYDYP